jgi:4-hydroxy-tetrahydrodipicolinate synthase
MMTEPIFGQVLTAMVTPFDTEGKIDDTAVAAVVEHLLANGSDGIVVCGTTGESPTLSHAEKLHLFRLVKEVVAGRGPIIAGTGGNDTAASIEITKEAAEIGVDGALLVVPPYNKPSQEGLYQHFLAIANAVPDLKVMLYNVPGRTAQNMDAATTIRLSHAAQNIVAVKEAAGNLVQCAEIYGKARPGFNIYSGDDGLALPMLAVGGVGVVSVSAHLVGKDMKRMHQAFAEGKLEEAASLNAKMIPMVKACFQASTPSPAPVKAGLNLLGVPAGGLRLPLVPANAAETEIVRKAMAEYGLL